MSTGVTAVLLGIFLIHLVAFVVLGLRRRQAYYLALVITFSLLSGAMLVRLLAPGVTVMGALPLDEALRRAAWVAAAVSIGWTATRVVHRIRTRADATGN